MPRKKTIEDRSAYEQAFHKENYTRFVIAINNKEAQLISHIKAQGNATAYIKKLIIQDMKKGG